MSAISAMNNTSPWSSPKDPYHLKRRHKRGNTNHSRSSSLSLTSPSSPFMSFSDTPIIKSHSFHENDFSCVDTPTAKHSPRAKDNKRNMSDKSLDDIEKSSQFTGVPSWFGSLRSFTISASSSTRGAFAPLLPATSSKTGSSISSHSQSRGRSSSIYYAGSLNDDDNDSDYYSENVDEPITDKNGLKENRVRGPSVNWTKLDPSLGRIFPSSYKAVPESESDLSVSPCSSSASSMHSPNSEIVDDLAISEIRYRDSDSGDDTDSRGEGLGFTMSKYETNSSTAAAVAYPKPTASSPTATAFSLIKSYVPSLPNFQESNSSSAASSENKVESNASAGAGFWSIRKLSMNILSSTQYTTLESSSEEENNNIMTELNSPFQLPEILLRIVSFLELNDRINAVQVSKFWNKTLQTNVPSGSLVWKDTMSESEREAVFHSLCHDNIRTLECHLRSFEGKALGYFKERAKQLAMWKPVMEALKKGKGPESDDPDIQIQKLVVKGSNFIDEDFLYTLLEVKTLKHFWIDPLPGRSFTPDISKLVKVLGQPAPQSLRTLTVKNAWWPNMPSNGRCQLRKISLEKTSLTNQNVARLLEICPLLEEFEAIDSIAQWIPGTLIHISRVNPLLKSFIISCNPTSTGDKLDNLQVSWIVDNLNVDLRTLGLYRLDCTPEMFTKLQNKFKNLTRLEIHEGFDGTIIHEYLSTSPQLRHLVARDVVVPISLLQDKTTTWACKDLLTLELSFGGSTEGQTDSKYIFEYLANYVPNIQLLRIRKQDLSLKQGQGVEFLKELKDLKDLTIASGSIDSSVAVDDPELAELREHVNKLSLQPFENTQQ
ncbi:hypothetical protein BGZ76_006013 [Entomortierella beljakovae]|nr:hypothetical protein BGZ76_006013 [Entomortierella beljakovae]